MIKCKIIGHKFLEYKEDVETMTNPVGGTWNIPSISLLKSLTKNVRAVDKEKEKIKWERHHKMNDIISRLRYLSWEEFQKFYYEFTGKKKE
jgi:hypothetical protein